MTLSAELQSKLEELRAKTIAGTITQDELREGIQLLREHRLAAVISGKAKATKKVTKSSDELLAELGEF